MCTENKCRQKSKEVQGNFWGNIQNDLTKFKAVHSELRAQKDVSTYVVHWPWISTPDDLDTFLAFRMCV